MEQDEHATAVDLLWMLLICRVRLRCVVNVEQKKSAFKICHITFLEDKTNKQMKGILIVMYMITFSLIKIKRVVQTIIFLSPYYPVISHYRTVTLTGIINIHSTIFILDFTVNVVSKFLLQFF